MQTNTLLTTMLAGAAVCALSTAPALAAAPSVHVSAMFKAPLKVTSGLNHFKTVMGDRTAHNASNFTSTVDITGTVSSHFSGLLYAYTWYTQTTGGKCVQPKKQKQKYKLVKGAVGKIKGGTTVATNPCGTGNFTYYGPVATEKGSGNGSFKGTLTAKKFYGDNLLLNEDVTLTVS